jgi:hypothetical protein
LLTVYCCPPRFNSDREHAQLIAEIETIGKQRTWLWRDWLFWFSEPKTLALEMPEQREVRRLRQELE